MRVGSLCSGYGGLDLGLELALGPVEHAWHVEYDKHPSAILAHHWPDVPNYGDVKHTDWTQVEPVDWLTAGYPCQPFSHAGNRQGADDARHLWPGVANAIRVVRPRNVLLENVAGHLSLGFGQVLGDLAALGYDARWVCLRAADAGAPHNRARIFVLATDAESTGQRRERSDLPGADGGVAGEAWARRRPDGDAAGRGGAAATDTHGATGRLSERSGQAPGAGGRGEGEARADLRQDAGGERGTATDTRGERHGTGVHPRGVGRLDRTDAGGARERERARQEPRDRGSASASGARGGSLTGLAAAGDGLRLAAERSDLAPAHSTGLGRGEGRAESARLKRGSDAPERRDSAPADPEHDGLDGAALRRGSGAGEDARGLLEPQGLDAHSWGAYESAIRRWERVLGRSAPRPTEPGRNGERLSPRFVEWMMGLPAGWVTDVPGLPRNAQLKALGNGVVPQQAALALRLLGVSREEVAA